MQKQNTKSMSYLSNQKPSPHSAQKHSTSAPGAHSNSKNRNAAGNERRKNLQGQATSNRNSAGNSAAQNRNRNRNRNAGNPPSGRSGAPAPQKAAPPSRKQASKSAERPQRQRRQTSGSARSGGVLSLLFYAVFRYFQKKFGGFVSCCICVFSLYLLASGIFCAIYAGFFFGNTRRHDAVAYLYTDGTEDEKHPAKEQRLSYDNVFRGESEPYVNMTELSKTLGLIIVGNNHQLRFSLPDVPESSVLFTDKSRNVIVNGSNSVVLSSPAKIVDRTVYVPLSFLRYYTTGLEASYDQKENRITIERLVDESASTDTALVYLPFTYTIGEVSALDTIPEEDILP